MLTVQLACLVLVAAPDLGLRDGDLVFQRSRSAQSRAISVATHSPYTHMGVIYMVRDRPMVLEAARQVTLTGLEDFVERGVGGHFVVKRLHDADAVLTPEVTRRLREVGDSFRGRPYDLAFAWDDERLYCSELAFKLYEQAVGVTLGELQRLADFDLSHPAVRLLLRKRYGEAVPLEAQVISPASIFADPRLATVLER